MKYDVTSFLNVLWVEHRKYKKMKSKKDIKNYLPVSTITVGPFTKQRISRVTPIWATVDSKSIYLNFAWENNFDTLRAFHQFLSCPIIKIVFVVKMKIIDF